MRPRRETNLARNPSGAGLIVRSAREFPRGLPRQRWPELHVESVPDDLEMAINIDDNIVITGRCTASTGPDKSPASRLERPSLARIRPLTVAKCDPSCRFSAATTTPGATARTSLRLWIPSRFSESVDLSNAIDVTRYQASIDLTLFPLSRRASSTARFALIRPWPNRILRPFIYGRIPILSHVSRMIYVVPLPSLPDARQRPRPRRPRHMEPRNLFPS